MDPLNVSHRSCIGWTNTSRQIGLINSSIQDSICVVAKGSWLGFCCGAMSAGVLSHASGFCHGPCKRACFYYNPIVCSECYECKRKKF